MRRQVREIDGDLVKEFKPYEGNGVCTRCGYNRLNQFVVIHDGHPKRISDSVYRKMVIASAKASERRGDIRVMDYYSKYLNILHTRD